VIISFSSSELDKIVFRLYVNTDSQFRYFEATSMVSEGVGATKMARVVSLRFHVKEEGEIITQSLSLLSVSLELISTFIKDLK
jgi:hypothetical protein